MKITCWTSSGEKRRIRSVRRADTEAVRAAVLNARGDERQGGGVLWRQDRLGPVLRNAARAVLGVGSTVVVGLLVALAVAGADTRTPLLVAFVVVVVVGGGFVGFVWATDVGIEVHDDGRLVRTGWSGIEEYDLRSYERVTVDPR